MMMTRDPAAEYEFNKRASGLTGDPGALLII